MMSKYAIVVCHGDYYIGLMDTSDDWFEAVGKAVCLFEDLIEDECDMGNTIIKRNDFIPLDVDSGFVWSYRFKRPGNADSDPENITTVNLLINQEYTRKKAKSDE